MTTFTTLSSACLAAVLACMFAGVCAYGEYGDYLIPDTDGYYPLDKRSSSAYCRRCMSSDYDWLSCYKCWDKPGSWPVPYYAGKKKRGYYTRPGHIVPYYAGKRAADTLEDVDFPEEYLEEEEKRGSLSKCSCCTRTKNQRCCKSCRSFFAAREEKRGYETSFADYGGEEQGCACCTKGYFSLNCCINCLSKK